MRIAAELNLPEATQNSLYYALLLKDAGRSKVAGICNASLLNEDAPASEEHFVKTPETAWTQLEGDLVTVRFERADMMARLLGLPAETAAGIAGIAEHWNGEGHPQGLARHQIPIVSRIMLLAQTLDALFTISGPEEALRIVSERSRSWFDPEMVKAAQSLARRAQLWTHLAGNKLTQVAVQLEPSPRILSERDATLDSICQAFAMIVDAKSPFTYCHSNAVANVAVMMAKQLGLENSRVLLLRRAALLHDLGKMAVPDAVLQKPGKLNRTEWQAIYAHPAHTWRILSSIRGFEEMSEVAASHHERLNGTGYFRGLTAPQLSIESRVLMVADIFDALSTKRPYRDGIPRERVFEIIRQNAPHELDATCVEALEQLGIDSDQCVKDLCSLRTQLAFSAGYSVAETKSNEANACA